MAVIAGRTYPAVQIEIDSERAAAFARAIGADPADGVPPTFAAVYSLGVTAAQLFDDRAVDATSGGAALCRSRALFVIRS